jgi:hypothetical protein
VDWKMKNLHFESINETTPKYEASPTSTLDSKHDYACENITRSIQRMQKLKLEGDIGDN